MVAARVRRRRRRTMRRLVLPLLGIVISGKIGVIYCCSQPKGLNSLAPSCPWRPVVQASSCPGAQLSASAQLSTRPVVLRPWASTPQQWDPNPSEWDPTPSVWDPIPPQWDPPPNEWDPSPPQCVPSPPEYDPTPTQ
jgi:hypothetical protein